MDKFDLSPHLLAYSPALRRSLRADPLKLVARNQRFGDGQDQPGSVSSVVPFSSNEGGRNALRAAARTGLIAVALLCIGAADRDSKHHPKDSKLGTPSAHSASAQYPFSITISGGDEHSADKYQKLETPPDKERFWGISYEGWTAICTAVLTIATIGLGFFTFKLWQSTAKAIEDGAKGINAAQRSAKAAEDAISGAKAQLNHAQQSSERELRAYVFVTSGKAELRGAFVHLSIEVKNFGQTPAYGVRLCFDACFDERPDPPNLEAIDFGIIGSRADLGPGAFTNSPNKCPINLDLMLARTHAPYFYGAVCYSDAFGVLRETYFRFLVDVEQTAEGAIAYVIPHYQGNYST